MKPDYIYSTRDKNKAMEKIVKIWNSFTSTEREIYANRSAAERWLKNKLENKKSGAKQNN